MSGPNESSERPAGEETVQALIASEPWKQLEHEAVGLADRLTEARAERDQAIRERDEARAAVARVEALADEAVRRSVRMLSAANQHVGERAAVVFAVDIRAALPGGAGEQDTAEPCSTCGGTGLVDWAPGQIRHLEGDQQPCPDCPEGAQR